MTPAKPTVENKYQRARLEWVCPRCARRGARRDTDSSGVAA